jgi:GNAT superfamily N-acetyltransferase
MIQMLELSRNPLRIRAATVDDVPIVFSLIQALADYEKLSDQVVGSETALKQHMFGDRPYCESIIALQDTTPVGFALFFHNYSTFLTQPGLYLEDIFVLPAYRGQGIGKALLSHLAKVALERECGRLEWSVLDWNEPAIGFYQRLGAEVLPDWRICRMTGEAIATLADCALPANSIQPTSPKDL